MEERRTLEDGSILIRSGEGIYALQLLSMCDGLPIDKEEGEKLWNNGLGVRKTI